MAKDNRNKAGHVETLYAIALIGIFAGLTVPVVQGHRMNKSVKNYAITRYGDHVAPLTDLEKAEWYKDMGVVRGEKPSPEQLEYFYKNCRDNVFF